MCKKQLLSLLPLVVLLSMSRSGYAANVLEGRKLAEQWCAKCHNIEKGAPFKLTPRALPQLQLTGRMTAFLATS